MIAVDTSALIAILFGEAEARAFVTTAQNAGLALVGGPTALEAYMVALGQSNSEVAEELKAMLARPPFEIISFTSAHVEIATKAFDRFGKGRNAAALNYGDCMSYAVAMLAGCPLLFKGQDFARTDVVQAV